MSRNHNDSDLRHCCVGRWYHWNHLHSRTVTVEKQQQHQHSFFWWKNIQRTSGGCQKDVRITSRVCRDKYGKRIKIYPEDVQRKPRGCPEDIQRMPIGHPEGSKGSPEEGLGMYNNAYISMSRNHNDSDLNKALLCRWMIPEKPFKQWNCDCEEQQQHQHSFFDGKNTKDVWRISEGCQDDVYRM